MPTNPPLGFDSNEYTSEGEFYRSNRPEQLRLDEKRNYAFGGGLLKGITELPLELLEMMSPADEYVPGALAPDQSSPRQRLRTERLHGEQFYDELKADPDTAQAAEVGYGTSFVVDPIIDTGIGLAPHLVKGFKAISKGERAAPKLANLMSDEKGMIVGRHGLDELGIDPESDLIGQYSGLWDKGVRAELDDSSAFINPDVDVTSGWGIATDTAEATRPARKAEAESLREDGWPEKKIYKLTGMVDRGDGYVDILNPKSKRPYTNEALAKTDPTLAEDIRIRMEGERGLVAGGYNSEQDEILSFTVGDGGVKGPRTKETVHHELQHAIQGREGFAQGGSPDQFAVAVEKDAMRKPEVERHIMVAENKASDSAEFAIRKNDVELIKKAEEFAAKNGPFYESATTQQKIKEYILDHDEGYNRLYKEAAELRYGTGKLDAHERYKRLAGEWEARNTGKRATLSPDDERLGEVVEKLGVKFRSGKPFSTADDIALNDLIVKMDGGRAVSQPIPVDLSKQSLSEVFSEARAGRMERATEQGFDIDEPLYHGSGDISDFSSFDPAKTGKGADQYGSGFYLTTSPQEASGYAMDIDRGQGKFKSKNPGVVQAYSNMKNYIDVDPKTQRNLDDVIDLDSSQVRKMLDKSDALKRGMDDEDMNPAGDHFDSFWNDGVEDWMLDDLAETYAHGSPESIEAELFDGDSEAFRRALGEATGMQGLRINFDDGLSHVIPWFPENIRSVNAQFDPAKAKSGELLATAAGASVALSAANREPQPVDMSKTTLREVLGR